MNLKKKMKKYGPSQVFNLDDTKIFYRLFFHKASTSGYKNFKDGVSIMFCCNDDGSDKCIPLMIAE